ncbi:Ldh family oxidoreductase [Actinomycetes bacterium KLBMP 9759]
MIVRVPAGELEAFVAGSLEGLAVPVGDAVAVAEVLVYADLRGLDAHGVYRLPAYMERVSLGLVRGTEELVEAAGSGAVRRIDAAFALGPAAATAATDLAVELARQHGIGLVGVGRSTHLGAAGFYALRAARQEMVAFVLSNGPRVVAPAGAAEPFLGTNPLAIGIPLGRHGAYVHDMATGASRAKIRRAADAGLPIAPGEAVDADGRPTTDAAAALLGSVLPIGGAKGSGLSVAIALLAGMLGGAEFDDEIAETYGAMDRPQNIGHVVVVVDPWCLGPREETLARVEAMVDRLHALRPAEGVERVRFSGEQAARRAEQRFAEGIPIAVDELRRLALACKQHGLTEQAKWAEGQAQAAP